MSISWFRYRTRDTSDATTGGEVGEGYKDLSVLSSQLPVNLYLKMTSKKNKTKRRWWSRGYDVVRYSLVIKHPWSLVVRLLFDFWPPSLNTSLYTEVPLPKSSRMQSGMFYRTKWCYCKVLIHDCNKRSVTCCVYVHRTVAQKGFHLE